MTVTPAYAIPLSQTELSLIGEICAIQGQIEFLMQTITRTLLGVDHVTVLAILGSTTIGTNADIFIKIVRLKVLSHPNGLCAAEFAYAGIRELAEGRNDFVHALYAHAAGPDGFVLALEHRARAPMKVVAIRMKKHTRREVTDLQLVRDHAAKISCALAFLNQALQAGDDARNPWRGKF